MLGSNLRGLAENICARLNMSLSNTFRNGSGDAQYHASTPIDGITLHFREDLRRKRLEL